ncbi:TonB-dependent receptor [Cyclobacterium qasimii M12-11B]|uniref:TonB-dependent receptor n=1 Tax=Cyclobacterium qasimii M12-11B TaxID=641524 RepID=S7WX58_9BACT|nr:TonB-dependent receptor [Cyclobacterium qasimii M12-11B]
MFMTTLAAHEINAQIRPIDESFIRLNKVQWDLAEIFRKVEKSTDYKFVLPEEILDKNPN